MALRPCFPALLTVVALALPLGAHADGDAARGRDLAYTCYGCHGIPNYKNVYPTYSVPMLSGQHPEYLAAALKGYKDGSRAHGTMHSQAASLSDQDMQDVAAFFAGTSLKPGAQPLGTPPKKAQELCVACHGPEGIGITPEYPTLAGQHADYLEQALREYRDGGRKNPIMAGFVNGLTDAEIRELAEYFARQRPALETPKHAMWFAQEGHDNKKKAD